MKIIAIIFGVVIVILLGILFFFPSAKAPTDTSDVPGVMAVSPDGHVEVASPRAGDLIDSPLVVSGTVTGGGWFSEDSFPVKVVDANGAVLGTGHAQAQPMQDWTSTGTVVFVANLVFSSPYSSTGTIVLSSGNPSGLPLPGESFGIPVRF